MVHMHCCSVSDWGIVRPGTFLPPPHQKKVEYLLAVSKNLAHPLHPVYDDGKGGGWKWWE